MVTVEGRREGCVADTPCAGPVARHGCVCIVLVYPNTSIHNKYKTHIIYKTSQ